MVKKIVKKIIKKIVKKIVKKIIKKSLKKIVKKFHQIDLVTLNFPVYRGIPPTLLLIFFFLRCALWSKKYLKPEFKPNETNLKIVKKSSKKYLERSSKNRQTNCKKNRQKNVKKISEKFRQIDLVTLNFPVCLVGWGLGTQNSGTQG